MNTVTQASDIYYINTRHHYAPAQFSRCLLAMMADHPKNQKKPVIVCIGSDRVTGDSLGPLVGTYLHAHAAGRMHIYGTLNAPVHALNLKDAMRTIQRRHRDNLVIAVDASLGSKNHLGYITLSRQSLFPGAGVQKKLEAIGDISITGIISTAGAMSQLSLQTARLSTVISLADCIASGILQAARQL